jgi:hypothetical protein
MVVAGYNHTHEWLVGHRVVNPVIKEGFKKKYMPVSINECFPSRRHVGKSEA